MAEPKKRQKDAAADRPQRRTDYQAGADGTQHVETSPGGADGQLGPDEISEPDEVIKNNESKLHSSAPDHSEREGGGDQDIDTAGMIPGNKATDGKAQDGF